MCHGAGIRRTRNPIVKTSERHGRRWSRNVQAANHERSSRPAPALRRHSIRPRPSCGLSVPGMTHAVWCKRRGQRALTASQRLIIERQHGHNAGLSGLHRGRKRWSRHPRAESVPPIRLLRRLGGGYQRRWLRRSDHRRAIRSGGEQHQAPGWQYLCGVGLGGSPCSEH